MVKKMFICCLGSLLLVGCNRTPEEALFKAIQSQYPQSNRERHPPEVPPLSEEEREALMEQVDPIWENGVMTTWLALQGQEADAICIGFGELTEARCIPTDRDIPGVASSSSQVSLEWVIPSDLCQKTGDRCQDAMMYVFAEVSGEYTSPRPFPLATACSSCGDESCFDLVQECEEADFCLSGEDCEDGFDCLRGQCVGGGALHFQLNWSAFSDLDLHVEAPSGEEIYYGNSSGSGGYLDKDDLNGGANATENIFFEAPEDGRYDVWVELYSGSGGLYSLTGIKEGERVIDEVGRLGDGVNSSPRFSTRY